MILAVLLLLSMFSAQAQDSQIPVALLVEGDVWTYDLVADTWTQHTHEGVYREPAMSADGSLLVVRGADPDFTDAVQRGEIVGDVWTPNNIWLIRLPDGEPERLSAFDQEDGETVIHSAPSIAPDTNTVYWTEYRVMARSNRLAVYDGENARRYPIQFPAGVELYFETIPVKAGSQGQVALSWYGFDAEGNAGTFVGVFELQEEMFAPVYITRYFEQRWTVRDFVTLSNAPRVAVLDEFNRWQLASPEGMADVQMSLFGGDTELRPYIRYGVEHDPAFYWLVYFNGGVVQLPFDNGWIDTVAVSPDGAQVAAATEGGLTIWDFAEGTQTQVARPDNLTPSAIAWSQATWDVSSSRLPTEVDDFCGNGILSFHGDSSRTLALETLDIYDEALQNVVGQLEAGTVFERADVICQPDRWWVLVHLNGDYLGYVPETTPGGERRFILPESMVRE
jgi:hypothetical protein